MTNSSYVGISASTVIIWNGCGAMGKRSDYKKIDGLVSWDLDKGCRRIVDQSTPGRRRLRDRLKRQARKRINRGIGNGAEQDV